MPTLELPDTGRRPAVGPVTLGASESISLGLAPAGHKASTGSLSLPPPATGTETAITVDLWDATDTNPLGPVANTNAREWTDAVTTLGSGSLSVPIGSAAEQIAANQLSPGKHLRFSYQGRPSFSARIEANEAMRLHREHRAQRATVRAVDKRIVLDRFKVKPSWSGGIQSNARRFGWMSPEQSTAGWKNAVVVQPAISLSWQIPNTNPPWFQPWEPPKGWADLFANVIQPRTGILMPAGEWAARGVVTISTPDWYIFQLASMGGPAELYMNSEKVAETAQDGNSWLTPIEVAIPLEAGTIHVGVKVTKEDLPNPGGLPGTLANFNRRSLFACSVYRLPSGPSTTVTAALRHTQASAAWKVLDFPSRFPAPTVGRIVRQLVEECDGLPANFELGFSDTHDSAGLLWPLNDETTFRDSDSVWDAIRRLRAGGYESRMSTTGYRLDLWGPANFPGSTPIKVESAEQVEQPTLPNRLIVQWSRGRFTVERSAAERVEAKLDLGEVRTEQEARAIANAELDRFELRADRWRARPVLWPQDGLYDTWRSRDWVNIAGNGYDVDLKVESVTVTEDGQQFASAEMALTSPLEFLDEELQRQVNRMGPGGLGDSASPVRWLDPGVRVGFVQEERIPEFSQSIVVKFPDEGSESTVHNFDVPTRISLIRITAVSNPNVVGPGVQVQVRRSGANINPFLFLPPGVHHAVYLPDHLVFQPGQNLSCKMLDAADGAGLVAVSFHAAVAAPGAVRPEKPFPWL